MGENIHPAQKRFLIIDHNPDSAELLARSLRRKFALAAMFQTPDSDDALKTLASVQIAAVILHRALGADAVQMTTALRQVNPTVPIIVVSGVDRSESVLAAGATGFLKFDEWLMLGNVVTNALGDSPPGEAKAD